MFSHLKVVHRYKNTGRSVAQNNTYREVLCILTDVPCRKKTNWQEKTRYADFARKMYCKTKETMHANYLVASFVYTVS